MIVIVVTGGIGSGKSEACTFLSEEYGMPVYCADRMVKELYVKSPDLLMSIENELGTVFRNDDGTFSPSALAKVIFSDPSALAKVESLVFPLLTEDFSRWKQEHSGYKHVILESATILEKPQLKDLGDITLLIDAPVGIRAERAARRDAADIADVMKRMMAQPVMNDVSDGIIDAPADFVIVNDSTVAALHLKLRKFAENLV